MRALLVWGLLADALLEADDVVVGGSVLVGAEELAGDALLPPPTL
jgi:hypothetical protein